MSLLRRAQYVVREPIVTTFLPKVIVIVYNVSKFIKELTLNALTEKTKRN